MKTLTILSLFLLSTLSFSAQKADVEFSDTIRVEGKELTLNGLGIRRATIFNVKVYVGGLYVLSKSQDPQKILSQDNPKRITMKFVRSVDADDLQEAWLEGFNAAIPKKELDSLMTAFNKFNATMRDVKEGDSIILNFLDQGVQVSVKGEKHPFIGDKAFSKALLSIWFIHARDERLRDELLGKE